MPCPDGQNCYRRADPDPLDIWVCIRSYEGFVYKSLISSTSGSFVPIPHSYANTVPKQYREYVCTYSSEAADKLGQLTTGYLALGPDGA